MRVFLAWLCYHTSFAALLSSPVLSYLDTSLAPAVEAWKDGEIGTLLRSLFPHDDAKPETFINTAESRINPHIEMQIIPDGILSVEPSLEDSSGDDKREESKESRQRRRLIESNGFSCMSGGVDALSTALEGDISDNIRDLTSPTNYRPSMDCSIIIKPGLTSSENASGAQFNILLEFTTFETEGSESLECHGCSCDFAVVQDDAEVNLSFPWGSFVTPNFIGVDWPLTGRICGSTRYDFLSGSSSLRVSFHSDGSLQSQGFVAHYSRVMLPARTVKFVRPRYYIEANATNALIEIQCVQCQGGETIVVTPRLSALWSVDSVALKLPSPSIPYPSYPLSFSAGTRIQTVSLPLQSWLPCQPGNTSSFCIANAFGVSLARRTAWMLLVGLDSPSQGVIVGTQTGQFRPHAATKWNLPTQDSNAREMVSDSNKVTVVTVAPIVAVLSISQRTIVVDQDQTEVSVTLVCRDCSGVNVVASLNSDTSQIILPNNTQVVFPSDPIEENSRSSQPYDEKRLTYTFSVSHSDIAVFASLTISATLCPQLPYPNLPCTSTTNGTIGATKLNTFPVIADPLQASIRLQIVAAGCSDVSVRLTAARPKFECVDRRGRSVKVSPQVFIERTSLPSQRIEQLSKIQLPFGEGICERQNPSSILFNLSIAQCALRCVLPDCSWYSFCNNSCSQSSENTCLLFAQAVCHLTSNSYSSDYVSLSPSPFPTSRPTHLPTLSPSSLSPTTLIPTISPTTSPSLSPSSSSTSSPTLSSQTNISTSSPSAFAPSSSSQNNTLSPTSSSQSITPTSSPSKTPSNFTPTPPSLILNPENFKTFRTLQREEVCGSSLLKYFNLTSFNDLIPPFSLTSETLSDTSDTERVAAWCGIESLFEGKVELDPAQVIFNPTDPRAWYCRALIACTQREVCTATLEAKDACMCPLDRTGDKCFTTEPYFCTLSRKGSPISSDRAANPEANTILPSDCDMNVFKKYPEYRLELGGSPPCQSISVEKGAASVHVPLQLRCGFAAYPSEGVKTSTLVQAGFSYPNVVPHFEYAINTITTTVPSIKSTLPYYSTMSKAEPSLNITTNFTDYHYYCNVRGKRLPTYSEFCPFGVGRPAVIPASSTLYVPILSNVSEESWVQIGPSPGRVCSEVEEGPIQGVFGCVSQAGHWQSEDENIADAIRMAGIPVPVVQTPARVVRDNIDRGFAFSAKDTTQFAMVSTAINYNRPNSGRILGITRIPIDNLSASFHNMTVSAAGLPSQYRTSGRVSIELQLLALVLRGGANTLIAPPGLARKAITTEHFEVTNWTPPPPSNVERGSGLTFVLNVVVVVCVVAFCGLARVVRECCRNKHKQS